MQAIFKTLVVVFVTVICSCKGVTDCNPKSDLYSTLLMEDNNHVVSLSKVPFIVQSNSLIAKISSTQIVDYDLCSGEFNELINLNLINADSLADLFFSDISGVLKPSLLDASSPLTLIATDFIATGQGLNTICLLTIPSRIDFRGLKATLTNRYALMLEFNGKMWSFKPFDYRTKWDTVQPYTWFDYTGGMIVNQDGLIMNGYSLNKSTPKLCSMEFDETSGRYVLRDTLQINGLPSKYPSQTSSAIDRIVPYPNGMMLTRQNKVYSFKPSEERITWELDLGGYVHDVRWSTSSEMIYSLSEHSLESNKETILFYQINVNTRKVTKIDTILTADEVLGARIYGDYIHLITVIGENVVYSSKAIAP